jgi:hypothetical protein
MDMTLYEHDPGFVLERFRQGEFDFVDAVSEVEETEFFRYIGTRKILSKLAESYPSPRLKEEVPIWLYIASNLSMRFHGVHSFHAYPYVVRCGGMLNAFGPEVAHKVRHPDTQDVTLHCNGFNAKNSYDRQTPCDQDFLRKLARTTPEEALLRWFNQDVVKILRKHKAFDPEGIFLGDASYLFVPDNPNYENSVRLLFDEHNHPVESKKLSRQEQDRYTWRRCYKLISLVHTNRKGEFFLYAGLRVVSGEAHECPILYEMVDGFVDAVGQGVMKRLILDRGFIDGEQIARLKKSHKIDTLIPLRKNMDIYQDALGLLKGGMVSLKPYHPPSPKPSPQAKPRKVPEGIRKREAKRQATLEAQKQNQPPPPPEKTISRREIAKCSGLRSWSSCTVPVDVIINKDIYVDGHEQTWLLMDTKPVNDPATSRDDYRLRTEIEERHRQLKCFWDLADFRGRVLSLVVNQVVFVALAYSLLQLYLLRKVQRPELNRRTRIRLRDQLLPSDSNIILYCENRFAFLSTLEYTDLLLNLSEPARQKILAKTRRLKRQVATELKHPRAP